MPQYTISPGIASNVIGEGFQLTFTITGNAPNGTQLYWSNAGTTNAADFVEGMTSGFLTMSNNQATLQMTLENDALTEGPETIDIHVYENRVVATTPIIVVPDTSTIPVYTISPANSVTVAGEGITLTFTISTDASDGHRFYWANLGTTTAADFVENVNNGFLDANNGSATLTLNLKNDNLTEGDETVRIALYHDEARTHLALLSGVVTVPDTSTTPFAPTSLGNLYMWMDGADPNNTGIKPANNTIMSTWVDKSGGSNNLTQQAANRNPTYSNDALLFTTDQGFAYPTTNPISGYDYYLVSTPLTTGYRTMGLATGMHVLLTENAKLGTYALTNATLFKQYGTISLSANTRILLGLRVASNGYPSVGIDGPTTYTAHVISNATNTQRTINFAGAPTFNQSWGTINEFVQYNSNLSLADRQKVEGYLAWKWNLTASLPTAHPYKTVNPSLTT